MSLKEKIRFIINYFFSIIPYILLNLFFVSVELIFLLNLFEGSFFLRSNIHYFFISFFILNLLCFKKILNHFFVNLNFKFFNYPLLFLGLIIIVYRSLTYAHAIDDFVFHMTHGFYSLTMWNSLNFFPTQSLDYIYPLLQLIYYIFIDSIGIRFSLLILSTLQLFWFLNLLERYKILFFKNKSENYFYLNIFFIFIYFLPELMLSHTTFMSDFYSVILTLEVLYIFLSKKNIFLGYIILPLSILAKQSLGLFLIPLYFYLFINNFKSLLKDKKFILVIIFYLFIIIFPIKSFFEIGNPFGLLYNNIFKSPLAPELPPRSGDMRWGPLNITQTIYWPLIAHFSERYIEFFSINKNYIYLPLFLIIPYLYSIWQIIKRKKILLNTIIFISILFWSNQSGYGRYHLALMSGIWILIIYENLNLFKLKLKFIHNLILITLLSLFLFTSIRLDYGMRNFIFEKFFPPKISYYYINLFKNGFKLLGKDRYYDIFDYIKNNFNSSDIEGIIIINRGVSTFYSMLGSKYKHLPVFSYIDSVKLNKFLKNKKINNKIKVKLLKYKNLNKILVLSVKDFPKDIIKKTDLFKKYKCIYVERDKLVPHFQHNNYFNYIHEYYCIR